jgi:hypothetical protein
LVSTLIRKCYFTFQFHSLFKGKEFKYPLLYTTQLLLTTICLSVKLFGERTPQHKQCHFEEKLLSNLSRRAWPTKNQSWAGVVTICRPPACLLAGIPCSRYLSEALVMTVWCTPSAAPTWWKMALCCTISTALHYYASLNCHLILAFAISKKCEPIEWQ